MQPLDMQCQSLLLFVGVVAEGTVEAEIGVHQPVLVDVASQHHFLTYFTGHCAAVASGAMEAGLVGGEGLDTKGAFTANIAFVRTIADLAILDRIPLLLMLFLQAIAHFHNAITKIFRAI